MAFSASSPISSLISTLSTARALDRSSLELCRTVYAARRRSRCSRRRAPGRWLRTRPAMQCTTRSSRTVITSDKGFDFWGESFGDQTSMWSWLRDRDACLQTVGRDRRQPQPVERPYASGRSLRCIDRKRHGRPRRLPRQEGFGHRRRGTRPLRGIHGRGLQAFPDSLFQTEEREGS